VNIQTGILIDLLRNNQWLQQCEEVSGLVPTGYWQQFTAAYHSLNRKALFISRVHGVDHVERVMLFGTLLAHGCGLSEEDVDLLLQVCSYHDVGRVNDGFDLVHGFRASLRLAKLTKLEGENLIIARAITHAHSIPDREMETVVNSYQVADVERCLTLGRIFKDADGLDRVRIRDLDPAFMRTEPAKRLTAFSEKIWQLYCEP